MSEYGVDFPVWDLSPAADGDYLLGPGSLDLSAGLVADLLAWQHLFDQGYHWEDGWRDDEARDAYAAQAPRLRDRLQAELGRGVDVVLDLWPAPPDPHR